MLSIRYFVRINIFLWILYKCVTCQDSIVSQGTERINGQTTQTIADQQPELETKQELSGPFDLNSGPNNEIVDTAHTLEGNVLKENPVERLNELSKDVSKEIRENPYYKLPSLTRKIREIAVLHPDLMEKLGVYVIPTNEEQKELEEETSEMDELKPEEGEESKEKEMRSEIEELIDKSEMIKAMTPEEKLEYIPKLKQTVVYQITKNSKILDQLSQQIGQHNSDMAQTQQKQEYGSEQNYEYGQEYQGYPYYQGYGYYPDYGYYPNYGYYQGNGYYPGGQYQSYPYYQNYAGYGY